MESLLPPSLLHQVGCGSLKLPISAANYFAVGKWDEIREDLLGSWKLQDAYKYNSKLQQHCLTIREINCLKGQEAKV